MIFIFPYILLNINKRKQYLQHIVVKLTDKSIS